MALGRSSREKKRLSSGEQPVTRACRHYGAGARSSTTFGTSFASWGRGGRAAERSGPKRNADTRIDGAVEFVILPEFGSPPAPAVENSLTAARDNLQLRKGAWQRVRLAMKRFRALHLPPSARSGLVRSAARGSRRGGAPGSCLVLGGRCGLRGLLENCCG